MTIYDLIFLAAVLLSIITLITAVIYALCGNGKKCLRIICVYGVCVVAYFVFALAVDFFKPQRVISIQQPWCFDDWCLQVENVNRSSNGHNVFYTLNLRLFSTARQVSQRAKGAWIYLIDEQGRRYSPNPDPLTMPLAVELGPQQSVTTSRAFTIPADVRKLGLITGHGSPYCVMDALIIGEGGCIFNKPTMIRIE